MINRTDLAHISIARSALVDLCAAHRNIYTKLTHLPEPRHPSVAKQMNQLQEKIAVLQRIVGELELIIETNGEM